MIYQHQAENNNSVSLLWRLLLIALVMRATFAKAAQVDGNDEDTAIVQGCQDQLDLILHTDGNETSAAKLTEWYDRDLAEYSSDPQRFLRKRSELCGRNFVGLGGRVILGDYEDVQSLVLEQPQQTRGWYLGRARLAKNRLPPSFLIALNDGEQHTVLRRFLWTEVVVPAQERLTQEQSDGCLLCFHHYYTNASRCQRLHCRDDWLRAVSPPQQPK